MLLIKCISQQFKRPVFEIMTWPKSELEYQAAFLSIDKDGDKPKTQKSLLANKPSVEQSIEDAKRILGG